MAAQPTEFDLGPAVGKGFSLGLRIDYVSVGGARSTRNVLVDQAIGGCLDSPEYIRGHDELTGERRTFRIERIEAIRKDSGAITDNIGWLIGQMIKLQLGEELNRKPEVFEVERPIILDVTDYEGREVRYEGRLIGARFDYVPRGPVLTLDLDAKPADGSRRRSRFKARIGPGAYGRTVNEMFDGDTGEVITEHFDWLAGGAASADDSV